jgi:hypothetical protein
MRQRLTQALVAELPADGRDRIVFDALDSGFGVRITKSGAKIFVAHARVGATLHRVSLGTFPKITVAAARGLARTALRDMRAGRDPVAERAARERAGENTAVTIAMLAERWMADEVRPKRKPLTTRDYERLLNDKIKPALGHLRVAQITKDDVLKFQASMAATPRRANYTISTLRALLTYAESWPRNGRT